VHSRASLALAVVVMLVSGYGIATAWAWPEKAALFPLAIGIPLFCMAAGEALWTLFGAAPAQGEARDVQLSLGEGSLRRTGFAVAWMLGFFAAIVLLGFPLAVPLFVFLYLKLQGGESWVLSIAFSIAVWAGFYALFDRLLHLPFAAGWLLSLLR
jgi:Tripartite tricarboxylate transporter TctB family